MLVLSRRKDEAIIIDGHIRVVVVSVKGDKVRLGIEAPKAIAVHREEIFKVIQEKEAETKLAKG